MLVNIKFESPNDEYPDHTEGPFEWIGAIDHNIFGLPLGQTKPTKLPGCEIRRHFGRRTLRGRPPG